MAWRKLVLQRPVSVDWKQFFFISPNVLFRWSSIPVRLRIRCQARENLITEDLIPETRSRDLGEFGKWVFAYIVASRRSGGWWVHVKDWNSVRVHYNFKAKPFSGVLSRWNGPLHFHAPVVERMKLRTCVPRSRIYPQQPRRLHTSLNAWETG